MARRPVAGDFLKDATPILSPTAAPVDTFVQPKRSLGKGQSLAAALGSVDKVVNPILKKEEEKAKKEEMSEGDQLFRQNREDFKEAVRSGTIPAGASPYVRKGYRRAQLHTLAANYNVQLSRSIEESEIYKVEDPAKVEEHLSEFYKQFKETNGLDGYDPVELQETFEPLVQKAHDGFRVRQAEKNVEWIEQERFRAFENEVLSTIDMQNFGQNRGEAINTTASWIMQKAEELDSEGLDRTQISKTIVDIVTAAADQRNDTDILKVLDRVKLGTGPLSNTQYGRLQRDRAKERIISDLYQQERRAYLREKKAREQLIDQTMGEAYQALLSNDEDAVEEARRKLVQVDPESAFAFERDLSWMRDETIERRKSQNWGEHRKDVLLLARESRDKTAVMDYLNNRVGVEIPGEDADQLRKEAFQLIEDTAWNKLYAETQVRNARSTVNRAVGQTEQGIITDTSAAQAAFATQDFDRALRELYEQYEGSVPQSELNKFVDQQTTQIIENYTGVTRGGGERDQVNIRGEDTADESGTDTSKTGTQTVAPSAIDQAQPGPGPHPLMRDDEQTPPDWAQ